MNPRRIAVTGAAGELGAYLARRWAGRYDLTLTDLKDPDNSLGSAQFFRIDLAHPEEGALDAAFEGRDAVVHLAANRSPRAAFGDLLEPNLIGLYHVFDAAARAGCRRLVYASSVNAVRGYAPERRVTPDMPPNPRNLYGATKVFGEAVARSYAHTHGMGAICIRYGGIRAKAPDKNPEEEASWITLRDAEQLTRLSVEAENVEYAVVHGFSRHRVCRWDIASARELLGYEPQDGTAVLTTKSREA